MKKFSHIKENIAYAKSILNKSRITQESPEWQDYLKIREICGQDHGYVGILTKLRFIEDVTDVDELKSIYEVLKKGKYDFAKLNKLTYEEILNLFYDELVGSKEDKKDYELIYKDKTYSYYRVYTYEGILEIGSPAWCLKTKSNWEKYQAKYPLQWVCIDNEYKGKLLTPKTNYLKEYKSKTGYVRYGISCSREENGSINWVAFNDSNANVDFIPNSHTFFGVMSTVLNLMRDVKMSYYDSFRGCKKSVEYDPYLEVVDKKAFSDRMNIGSDFFVDTDKVYVSLAKEYDFIPTILILSETIPRIFYPTRNENAKFSWSKLTGKISSKIIENHAFDADDVLYYGIKLKHGKITFDEIKSHDQYLTKIGKWLIFDRNSKYWVIVNSEPSEYQVPSQTLVKHDYGMTDPLCWYLGKEFKPYRVNGDYVFEVINGIKEYLKSTEPIIEPVEDPIETPKENKPERNIYNSRYFKEEEPDENTPVSNGGLIKKFKDWFSRK